MLSLVIYFKFVFSGGAKMKSYIYRDCVGKTKYTAAREIWAMLPGVTAHAQCFEATLSHYSPVFSMIGFTFT